MYVKQNVGFKGSEKSLPFFIFVYFSMIEYRKGFEHC